VSADRRQIDRGRSDPAFGRDAVVGPWKASKGGAEAGRGFTPLRYTFVLLLLPIPLILLLPMLRSSASWQGIVMMSAALLLLVPALIGGVTAIIWRPWARAYPAQPLQPEARWRLFQFVTLGTMGGLNGCAEIACDARWVHVRLMPPFGWLVAPRISLPRERLRLLRRSAAIPALVMEIDGRRLALPGWTLAEDGTAASSGESASTQRP